MSVVIPCYDREWCVAEAIDSVLHQTYRDWELIVVDDGSKDGSWELLQGYRDVAKLIQQPNGGVSAARNRGFREATGDYVLFLDSDDLLSSNSLELLVDAAVANPSSDVFAMGAGVRGWDGELRVQPSVWPRSSGRPLIELFLCPPPSPSCLLFKTARVRELGGFDPKLRVTEDSYLLLSILLAGGRFTGVPDTYALRRPSPNSLTATESELRFHRGYVYQYRNLRKRLPAGDSVPAALLEERMLVFRDRLWHASMRWHLSWRPVQVAKLTYRIVTAWAVDRGFLVYLLRHRPWSKSASPEDLASAMGQVAIPPAGQPVLPEHADLATAEPPVRDNELTGSASD